MEVNFSTVLDSNNNVSERDSSKRVLTGCFLSLLILTTLLGNTLVCAAVTRFRHLRSKVTNFFVISLAISDLLVAILVMPWKAAMEIVGFWPFGAFCNVWVAFDIMCSTASILNLCVISVDRYWAISSPFRYERKMTPKVAYIMIGVAWTLSILISFIPVQLNWHKAAVTAPYGGDALLNNDTYAATGSVPGGIPPFDNCDASLNRTYAISSSLISFYIPVAIMIVTYTRIYRIAQVQIRRISALERAAANAKNRHSCTGNVATVGESESSFKTSFKRETKVLKTLSVIMGVFVCCWLPFFILNCLAPFCDPDDGGESGGEGGEGNGDGSSGGGGGSGGGGSGSGSDFPCISPTTFDVFVWFGWANSSLNPIIYAFNADFRRAFSILLGCHRLCPGSSSANAVEIVSINNNGHAAAALPQPPQPATICGPYQPKGLLPKEANSHDCDDCGYVIPHSTLCPGGEGQREQEDEEEDEEAGMAEQEKLSPSPSISLSANLDIEPDVDVDMDMDVSLDKINPITQNGQQHVPLVC